MINNNKIPIVKFQLKNNNLALHLLAIMHLVLWICKNDWKSTVLERTLTNFSFSFPNSNKIHFGLDKTSFYTLKKLDSLSIKFTSGFMTKTKKKLISNTTLFSKNIKKESITNSFLSFINLSHFYFFISFIY